MDTPTLIALLHGPDQPGLVARVSGWIFARGGNILHADQHRDMQAGIFFQRIEWVPTGATGVAEREAADFLAFADSLGMQARVLVSSRRARIAVFVSKANHCFHDLILRWKAGDFSGDLVAIVGNHTDLAEAARVAERLEVQQHDARVVVNHAAVGAAFTRDVAHKHVARAARAGVAGSGNGLGGERVERCKRRWSLKRCGSGGSGSSITTTLSTTDFIVTAAAVLGSGGGKGASGKAPWDSDDEAENPFEKKEGVGASTLSS